MPSGFTLVKQSTSPQGSGENYLVDTETAEFECSPHQGVSLGIQHGTIKMVAIRVNDVQIQKPEIGAYFVDTQEMLNKFETLPEMAAAMARVRQQIADQQLVVSGLARLRLKQGLSQRQLAERMGTQQPAVARWERVDCDLKISTLQDIARALGVTNEEVLNAIIAKCTVETLQS